MHVRVMPPSLADKIAAGEVVERPASVVKELVENALDAGAHNITIEIRRGGISFIRVTDDGCGMHPEDAKIAFLRHATSKIYHEEDMVSIFTYGFRGEALAAIAAVSRIDLVTCTDSSKSAFLLSLEAGEITEEDETAAAVGTTIIVRDLFFNTPARLHFMKKDATEAAAIASMIERIALGRYDVSFTLVSDGKIVLQTHKSDDMKNVIHALFGSSVSDYLMPVDFEYKFAKFRGYVCKPNVMRSNRNMQFTYINHRYIKSQILYSAISDAYSANKETGKHPVCFLKVSMDPWEFDVNVHPTKMDVKFRDEGIMFTGTKYAVFNALHAALEFDPKTCVMVSDFVDAAYKALEDSDDDVVVPIQGFPLTVKRHTKDEDSEPIDLGCLLVGDKFKAIFAKDLDSDSVEEATIENDENGNIIVSGNIERGIEELLNFQPRNTSLRVLGELFTVYILAEYKDHFYLIDKHAAHEKIIYNSFVRNLQEQTNIPVQMLLTPIEIALSPEDFDLALQNAPTLYAAGFDFYEQQHNRIMLNSIPEILPADSNQIAFTEVLEELKLAKNKKITERQERALKTIACRAALKGGSYCEMEEIEQLVLDIINEEDIAHCPHGRPVMINLTRKEIDKMFKRIK